MDITRLLRGKKVAHVTTNGHILRLTTDDGVDLDVVWLDDNGVPMKGKPAVYSRGPRLRAEGIQDLIHYPRLRAQGEA
jgi:hypothetical protein